MPLPLPYPISRKDNLCRGLLALIVGLLTQTRFVSACLRMSSLLSTNNVQLCAHILYREEVLLAFFLFNGFEIHLLLEVTTN